MADPKVTACFKFDGKDCDAPVVNPGDWFGKTWLLSVECGYTPLLYVVEADNVTDAMDTLADSEEWGHTVAIAVDLAGDDYGEPLADGLQLGEELSSKADKAAKRLGVRREDLYITLNGNFVKESLIPPRYSGQGTPYDADWLMVYGQEGIPNGKGVPFSVTYHANGFPAKGINPLQYDEWDWDEGEERFYRYCLRHGERFYRGRCLDCQAEEENPDDCEV